jgi:hypothetical protein
MLSSRVRCMVQSISQTARQRGAKSQLYTEIPSPTCWERPIGLCTHTSRWDDSKGFQLIAMLPLCRRLRMLDLHNNMLTDAFMIEFTAKAWTARSAKSGAGPSSPSAHRLLKMQATATSILPRLEELRLHDNLTQSAGIRALAKALRSGLFPRLRLLYVGSPGPDDPDAGRDIQEACLQANISLHSCERLPTLLSPG